MEFFHTHVSDESKKLVQQVLDSGFLNQGKFVAQFEKELEDYGLKNVITLNSCTAALHLALEACNVKGKEVCLPSQTFIATGLAVLMAGAKPVFVDVNPTTGLINDIDLMKKVGEETAAILTVDWGGVPADIDLIRHRTNGEIPIISDSAHSLGAEILDRKVGGVADYTCFSFQAIKMLTTGDGGALCVKNSFQKDELLRKRWFGLDKRNLQRRYDGSRLTEVTELGYKYHMNDVEAACGLGNLHTLPDRLNRRRSLAMIYNRNLQNANVIFPGYPNHTKPAWWLYTVIIPQNKVGFCQYMDAAGIPVSSVDRGIQNNPVFGWSRKLPGQDWFDETQVSLPIHEALTMDDVRRVVDACNSWKG